MQKPKVDEKMFIGSIFISKGRLMKCINILATQEGVGFDDVCSISTYESYDPGDPDRCRKDEVVLNLNFAGSPEEETRITYGEFIELIKYGIAERWQRYSPSEQKEISEYLDKCIKIYRQSQIKKSDMQ